MLSCGVMTRSPTFVLCLSLSATSVGMGVGAGAATGGGEKQSVDTPDLLNKSSMSSTAFSTDSMLQ